MIKGTNTPNMSGAMVHISGRDQTGNLVEQLCDSGYDAASVVLYRAEKIPALPDNIATQLISGEIDAVMFYSSRTATHFVALTTLAGIKLSMTAYCLSESVAKILRQAGVANIKVAATSTEESMLALLV